MTRPPFILLGSAPLAPIALQELRKASYYPVAIIDNPRLSTDEILSVINEYKPVFLLVASYGSILKQEIIDSVDGKILNIHPSILPLYRGPSPVVQAILDGVSETGVTIIELDKKMDHGPILAQEKYSLQGNETPVDLYDVLTRKGVKLFLDIIDDYLQGTVTKIPQDHEKATFCYFIKKEQGLLNLSDSPELLERRVRAFIGWPGTWIIHNGKKLFIRKAHIENSDLVIDRVQPESRKEMSLVEFCAGQRIKPQDFSAIVAKNNNK